MQICEQDKGRIQSEDSIEITGKSENSTKAYKDYAREVFVLYHRGKYFLCFLFSVCYEPSLVAFSFLVLCGSVTMVKSSLLTKESVEKTLAAVTMKLRIKVPHFDNSALVQRYSKTLIGRCMNLRVQNMNQ